MVMTYCPKCHRPLPARGESCPHCGADIAWWMRRDGEVYGPYDLQTVWDCRHNGRIVDDDYVKLGGEGRWQRASDVLPLTAATPPAAPEPEEPQREPVTPPAAPPITPRRRRADIEVVIGTAWLTRIGMVAVLLAVAYLLSYAYTRGLINDQTIVCAGIVAGIAVMAGGEFAHRRGYVIQSQALTGGGAAVLYLTLFAGQHSYGILDSAITFPAMAAVTFAAAAQAIRHQSETVATFAWVTGYAVPLLIGDGSGADSGEPGPLFAYLVLLSVAVFVVAQRHTWPIFTGLALLGAYSSGAYIFRVSDGSLGWTLTYLMLVTAGMLWVSVSRKGRAGENFGAVGAMAGYLVTGTAMLTGDSGQPFVPYLYLLALSGAALWLGHMQGWRSLRWLGALGSFVGFLLLLPLMREAGVAQLGNWMLLYAAMSVAGILAVSTGRHPDAQPLAISAVTTAYAAAALLAWASPPGAVSDGAMFAYLVVLAAGVLLLTMRFEWATFSRLGLVAAFLATILLYERLPSGLSHYPLMYLVMLGAGALGVAAHREDRTLGAITVVGIFAALPLTGMMGPVAPELVVPIYLALAAIATLAVVEWQRWYGFEWIALAGTWALYLIWRGTSGHQAPDSASLNFTSVYLLTFLAGTWVRHGLRHERAQVHNAWLAGVNAAAYFGLGCYDLHVVERSGLLALGLFALYVVAGLAGIQRRPAESRFGPVLVGISIFFLTLAIPLLFQGYHITTLWALEATVLMGLGFHCRAPALRDGALIVLILPLCKAIALDSHIARDSYQVLLNSRALSMLAVIAAMYVGAYWYARFRDQIRDGERRHGAGLATFATVLLFWIVSSEAWTFVGWQLGKGVAAQHFALSGVWIIFGAVLMALGTARDLTYLRWAALGLFAVTTLKVLAGEPPLTSATYLPLVNPHVAPLLVIMALLYAVGAWYARTKSADDPERDVGTALVVAATGLLLWVASAEAWRFTGWSLGQAEAAQHFALSGVWVIFGAVLMTIGMARDVASLRWAALAVFAVTAIKTFGADPPLSELDYAPLINPHAAPLLAITVLLYAVAAWYARKKDTNDPERTVGTTLVVAATGLLLWVASSEAWLFLGWRTTAGVAGQHMALSMVWLIFGATMLIMGLQRRQAALRWVGLVAFGLTAGKVFIVDPNLTRSTYQLLANHHAFPLLVIAAMLFLASHWYRRNLQHVGEEEEMVASAMPFLASVLLWWVLTSEAWYFVDWGLNAGEDAQQYALSAVWTAYGAVLIAVGLIRRNASLRWIGMALLAITIVKVFFLDLRELDIVYKILALLGLGLVLIVVGFGYQRLVRDQAEQGRTED